jgi:hypothetical protein
MLCRHCDEMKVSRPRGLCWGCFYTPGVRDLYPPTSKYARRGEGFVSGATKPPEVPTTAPPGSPEKIAILEERARLKQSLWHPDDSYAVPQATSGMAC